MKQVLYIGAGAPWKGGAGYLVRQQMFLRALSKVAELHLALFDLPADIAAAPPEYAATLTALPAVRRVQYGDIRRFLADLLIPTPRMFRGTRAKASRLAVARLKPERFDAVFAFRIDFAHFAGVSDHPRLILDIDDPEHVRWARQLQATTIQGGDWRTLQDLRKLARFERRVAHGSLASFVCHASDRATFDPPPIVVPNCVDVPPACPPRRAATPRIIFLGNFAAASPNVDGLIWFLDEIWPLIRKEAPAAEFHVIGRVSADLGQRIGRAPGARAGGFADDLPAAMSAGSLSIAPIRYGTGTRIKILESFALGCPVVSTTRGCEGIDATPGEHLLVGDTAADFARQCINLLGDPAAQQRLAAAGYACVAANYNEASRRRELTETLADLLERCSAPPNGRAGSASPNAAPSAAKSPTIGLMR